MSAGESRKSYEYKLIIPLSWKGSLRVNRGVVLRFSSVWDFILKEQNGYLLLRQVSGERQVTLRYDGTTRQLIISALSRAAGLAAAKAIESAFEEPTYKSRAKRGWVRPDRPSVWGQRRDEVEFRSEGTFDIDDAC